MTARKGGGLAGAVHGAAAPSQRRKAPARATRDGPPPSRAGKRGIVIYVEPETAHALKILAAQLDTIIQALGAEALVGIRSEHEDN